MSFDYEAGIWPRTTSFGEPDEELEADDALCGEGQSVA